MSKLQFLALFSPSVGTFVLVILAWMHSNLRLNDLRDSTNGRFADADRQLSGLRADMNRQFDEVNRRLGLIEADQKQFHTVTGKLDGRIDEISRK